MRDWEASCAEGGQRWQVTCWEFGWDRDPEDTSFCWSILPKAPAPLPQDYGVCSCTTSQGRSVRGVSGAAQHNPKTKQPKQGPPNERALPLHRVLGEKGGPWSTERQGQYGYCTLVHVQNCTLTCQQLKIINKASLKRQ